MKNEMLSILCTKKSNLFILFIAVIIPFSCFANSHQQLFYEANRALESQKFEEAIQKYAELESKRIVSTGLYKNLAISYAGLKKYPQAILYLEKALKLSPNDVQLKSDLIVVRGQIPELEESLTPFIPLALWTRFTKSFPTYVWSGFGLICLAFMGGIFVKYLPNPGLSKKVTLYLLFSVLLFLVSTLAAYTGAHEVYYDKSMIVTREDVYLKVAPDDLSPDVNPIPAGSKIFLEDQIGEWILVKSEQGEFGWILKSQGQKI